MTTLIKTFRFKLYRSHRNRKLHRQINAAGLAYNHCVKLHRRYYRLYHAGLKKAKLQKHITKLKKIPGFSYFLEFGSQAEQNTVIPGLGKSIGFDFGLKDHILVAPTEEDDVDMPRFFKQNRNKLKKMQKKVSYKLLANTDHFVKKGKGQAPVYKRPLQECGNIKKCFKEQVRLYRKIANQREACHWRLAYELCGKYALISLESLNMLWTRKSHGRKVGDYGLSEFLSILKYVASRCGTTIVQIDKWFPSSQLCHDCGYQNKEIKDVRIRKWTCPVCGKQHDRDRNAAKNILREGLRQFEAT